MHPKCFWNNCRKISHVGQVNELVLKCQNNILPSEKDVRTYQYPRSNYPKMSTFCLLNCRLLCFQGEGVAYRGRVLLELETKLGVTPLETEEDLQSHEIIRVQVTIVNGLAACFLFYFNVFV